MSADLEQFYEIFFEESSELLAEMESCLLGLDVNAPDPEDLDAIFRAAHSIKGGAGTFGFTDMTEMTHMLESLLDKLRKGELEVKSEMVDSFLRAGDIIKGQLAGHRGDREADPVAAAGVCEELKNFSEGEPALVESSKAPNGDAAVSAETFEPVQTNEATAASPSMVFNIEFSCECVSPKAMENLLANLAGLGSVEDLASNQAQHHKLKITTDASEEDIWEALAFVVDPASLKIEAQVSQSVETSEIFPAASDKVAVDEAEEEAAPAPAPAPAPAQSEQNYGFFPGAPAAPKDIEDDQNIQLVQPVKAKKSKEAKPATASSETSSIRVSIEKVDQMINLVGELVITQAMLAQTASEVDPVVHERLVKGMNQLERNTRDLQESVMSIRMMPISFVFSRYPRVVRDLASKLGKQVELTTVGENTELDKGLIEKIADPLTHLVRNSLDHGIETPGKRIAVGKPAKGTITLSAFHQGGSIVIEVSDDGAGLNREKILALAKERGLSVNDAMPDQEVWMLIFEAGFSTAEIVTDVSGRGVGMDVVKQNIHGMGGRIEIESVFGVGSRISIRLPLTLAILDGLSVVVGDQMFIVPLAYITESLRSTAAEIRTVSGQGCVLNVRGEYLPVIALNEIFNISSSSKDISEGIFVIVDTDGKKTAMFVDGLVGLNQVVIKSLESNYRRVQGVSGATIMGDGKVALILDMAGLIMSSQ